MSEIQTSTTVHFDKLIQPAQLYNALTHNTDVLFVTHDYYSSVTSKTKLMRLVAEYAKKVNLPPILET